MAANETAGSCVRQSRPEVKNSLAQYTKSDAVSQESRDDRLIAERECAALSGLSRSTRYRLELVGQFPKRCHPTAALARWSLAEVVAWRDRLLADRVSQ